jgi:serine/threonine protein kinase
MDLTDAATGDIKPRNIVRFGEAIKLIDLDASVRLCAGAHLGVKFSTGYVPPEMLRLKSDGTVQVCSIALDDDGSFDHVNDDGYRVKVAATSVDMWSLGVVLYQLLAGKIN